MKNLTDSILKMRFPIADLARYDDANVQRKLEKALPYEHIGIRVNALMEKLAPGTKPVNHSKSLIEISELMIYHFTGKEICGDISELIEKSFAEWEYNEVLELLEIEISCIKYGDATIFSMEPRVFNHTTGYINDPVSLKVKY